MHGADEILAARVVDARLPADRAVDGRKQRRRHTDPAYAAQIRCRKIPGEIADHAATDGNNDTAPVDTACDQLTVEPVEYFGRFTLFADIKNDNVNRLARTRQGRRYRIDRRARCPIGHNDERCRITQARERNSFIELREGARSDSHIVTAAAQINAYVSHR